MAAMLNRNAYQKLIDEDVEWVQRQSRTMERDHVLHVLKGSVAQHYPPVIVLKGTLSEEDFKNQGHGLISNEPLTLIPDSWMMDAARKIYSVILIVPSPGQDQHDRDYFTDRIHRAILEARDEAITKTAKDRLSPPRGH